MIDYRFMLIHRRLRRQFRMATIERHQEQLARAIYQRVRPEHESTERAIRGWSGIKDPYDGLIPVVDQSEIAGLQQMGPACLPLTPCAPNSGFDSRDGGQS